MAWGLSRGLKAGQAEMGRANGAASELAMGAACGALTRPSRW